MKIQTSKSKEQIKSRQEFNKKVFFPTRYAFLNAHKSLRPGSIHGLLGPMGSGKSSLLKSIIAQVLVNKRVLVMLTEEDAEEYQVAINEMGLPESYFEKLFFIEESSFSEESLKSQESFWSELFEKVAVSKCECFFIDNVTTSKIYDGSFGVQSQTIAPKKLKKIARMFDIPVFYLAHTRKEITKNMHRLTEPEDIRGQASIAIESEFFYILHTFTQDDAFVNLVRVVKHRGYPGANGFFRLNWQDGAYWTDDRLNFKRVSEIFKKRDKI